MKICLFCQNVLLLIKDGKYFEVSNCFKINTSNSTILFLAEGAEDAENSWKTSATFAFSARNIDVVILILFLTKGVSEQVG